MFNLTILVFQMNKKNQTLPVHLFLTCIKAVKVILSVLNIPPAKDENIAADGAHAVGGTRGGNPQIHLYWLCPQFVHCHKHPKTPSMGLAFDRTCCVITMLDTVLKLFF